MGKNIPVSAPAHDWFLDDLHSLCHVHHKDVFGAKAMIFLKCPPFRGVCMLKVLKMGVASD